MSTNLDISKLPAERCDLGEGPTYDPHTNTAWWFNILAGKLHEYRFDTSVSVVHELPCMGSVIARIDGERQLIATEDGFYVRQISNGQLKRIAELEADNRNTRSNDGRVHPSGRLWIGTMGKAAEDKAGSIYWFDGAEIRSLYREITIPNSICFSPDGQTGYFTDTKINTVWRVALNPLDGMPRGEPEPFLKGSDLPTGGGFDGSVTDADGNLWNACWGGSAVNCFSPDGTLLKSIEVPAAQPSCPVFVGENLDTMLVTTAFEGYSDAQLAADPEAGFTFLVKGPFNGKAEPDFRMPD
ncbi:MAG: SMP-30/gluconolactonase/LRE family protein [Pseudomonadota bacterium]